MSQDAPDSERDTPSRGKRSWRVWAILLQGTGRSLAVLVYRVTVFAIDIRALLTASGRGGPRPEGWRGHWSRRYALALERAFGIRQPLDASLTADIAAATTFTRAALEPLPSGAEPADREGQPLPWRWERSLARDMLWPWGAGVAAASVLLGLLIILSTALP